ncbi:MAG: flagellar protein FlaG [Lachnospiraceae bacterium]|nr:flagellar protein FlaG [Lachnospiraceae bacterium]
MAIEPIGSMMTLQAQNVTPVETVKPVAQSMDAIALETGAKVDSTTQGVARAQESDPDAQGQGAFGNQNQPSSEQLKKAVDQMNKKMENSEAVFGFHEDTNRVTIKIVDKDSKKVIKELPPEKTLDMIAKVWEMAGILVDEKR